MSTIDNTSGFCDICDRHLQRVVTIDGLVSSCCGNTYMPKGGQQILYSEGNPDPNSKTTTYVNPDVCSKIVESHCTACKRITLHAIVLENDTMKEFRFCKECA